MLVVVVQTDGMRTPSLVDGSLKDTEARLGGPAHCVMRHELGLRGVDLLALWDAGDVGTNALFPFVRGPVLIARSATHGASTLTIADCQQLGEWLDTKEVDARERWLERARWAVRGMHR